MTKRELSFKWITYALCTLLLLFVLGCFSLVIIVGAVMMGKEKEQNHG